MAFKPWMITKDHLHSLIKGGENNNENWTVHEVLKATIILSTYHGLCCLCQGMALQPDEDIKKELDEFFSLSIVPPKEEKTPT